VTVGCRTRRKTLNGRARRGIAWRGEREGGTRRGREKGRVNWAALEIGDRAHALTLIAGGDSRLSEANLYAVGEGGCRKRRKTGRGGRNAALSGEEKGRAAHGVAGRRGGRVRWRWESGTGEKRHEHSRAQMTRQLAFERLQSQRGLLAVSR
jgi:hypothetical protein